jgi:hypothetical protein
MRYDSSSTADQARHNARSMASKDPDGRVRRRFRFLKLRLWDTLNQRLRGSFSVVVKVEHSLMLLVGYAALGASVRFFLP